LASECFIRFICKRKNLIVFHNLLGVALASLVPFLILLRGLAIIQIRSVIIIMNTGLPDSRIALSGQKQPFDRVGSTGSMSLAVGLCWSPKTNCGFSLR
jgi:hypothetical protein